MTLPDLCAGQKGHVALHKSIRSRLLDVREFASIQAAINAADGRGSVYVPDGDYFVTQTIQCAAGVDLILSHGAKLIAAQDIDVVKLAPRGGIRGGIIDCGAISTYTHAAIVLDGDSVFTFEPTQIADVQLRGSRQAGSTGMRFQVTQQADFYPYIFGVCVSNFGIRNFYNGIVMDVTALDGSQQFASIGANQFSNGFLVGCTYAIWMDAPTDLANSGGNTFANIQYQADAQSLRAVYCEGSHNQFHNLMVFDYPAGGTAIELTSTAQRNIISTNLTPSFVVDAGTTNKVITPDA